MLIYKQLPLPRPHTVAVCKLFIVFAVLLAGCQKEKFIDGILQIDAEALRNNNKAVVDGLNSAWQAGDEIRFSNGLTKTVAVDDGSFYINSEGITEGLSAVCPASAVGEGEVTLPSVYQYRTDGEGHQVIEMPMAAYHDGSGTLFFKHLTGGLFFNISNNTGATVKLDRITVENATYYMSGVSISMDAINSSFLSGDRVFTVSGDDVSRKRVSLVFNDGLELTSGASRQVLVPVPAFGTDAAFTVTVYAHNGEVSCFHFNQTQGGSHTGHITASEAGFANIPLGNVENAQPFEGTGTYASPYQIYTKEDYKRMVDSVNGDNAATYRTKHYDIAANIDMGGETVDGLRQFAGVIDGKGHTISNVCFGNSANGADLGMVSTLFSDARDTIRNLTFDHVTFTAGGANVGAFVGNAYVNRPYLVLQNCHLGHITYNTLASSVNVGGMIGYSSRYLNGGSIVVSGCSVNQPIVLDATQTSTCTGMLHFGGIAGNMGLSTQPFRVENSSLNAGITVYAPAARVIAGGITGNDGSTSTYTNVTVKTGTAVTVTGRDQIAVGGMIGAGSPYPCVFNGCTARNVEISAAAVANGYCRVGGLMGNGEAQNGKTFTDCHVSGRVSLTKGTSGSTSYMGMVSGSGGASLHWNDTERGNSASVTLTVTNAGSTNDHLGNVYGNQEDYSPSK